MATRNEHTSKPIARIASQGLRKPGSLSNAQIKRLSGSALTQVPNKKK